MIVLKYRSEGNWGGQASEDALLMETNTGELGVLRW
jgi:hypothetical protein